MSGLTIVDLQYLLEVAAILLVDLLHLVDVLRHCLHGSQRLYNYQLTI